MRNVCIAGSGWEKIEISIPNPQKDTIIGDCILQKCSIFGEYDKKNLIPIYT